LIEKILTPVSKAVTLKLTASSNKFSANTPLALSWVSENASYCYALSAPFNSQ